MNLIPRFGEMNSKKGRTRVYESSPVATIGEVDDGVSSFSYILDMLPSSIVTEILYRLGIKDIIRCKSVCKLWYKLITEPQFSSSYAKISKLTPLLFYERDERSQEHLYLLEFYQKGVCSQTPIVPNLPGWFKLTPELSDENSSFEIIGSCDGLLCWDRNWNRPENRKLESIDTVYIGNPIFGDYITLPDRYRGYRCYPRHVSGSSGNNIKVLRICFERADQFCFISCPIEKCEIFTVGVDNVWRDVTISGLAIYTKVVDFNGVFHWIPRGGFSNFISTFDLVEEKMGQISIPVELGLDKKPVELEVFNNQFCLVDYTDLSHSEITIWKTQEYSVAESWTKYVILKSSFPHYMHPYRFRSIAELEDGEILLSDSACVLNYLISYNIQEKKCSKIENFTSGKMMASRFNSYSPSFYKFTGVARNTLQCGRSV